MRREQSQWNINIIFYVYNIERDIHIILAVRRLHSRYTTGHDRGKRIYDNNIIYANETRREAKSKFKYQSDN